jgi:hypothetical protein
MTTEGETSHESTRMLQQVAREGLAGAANLVLFVVALGAGFRIVYPLVFSALKLGRVEPGFRAGLTEHQAIALSVSAAFAVSGVLSRLWTRHALNVGVVSAVIFIVGMILLGQAMYLADGGDPSLMWSYIRPQWPVYLSSLWCAAGATLGWYIGGILWRRLRSGAVHDSE